MRIPSHKVVLAAAACLLGSGPSIADTSVQARTGNVSLRGVRSRTVDDSRDPGGDGQRQNLVSAAHGVLPGADRAAEPGAERGHHDQPDRAARGLVQRHPAHHPSAARTDGWHSGPAQGQRRHADHARPPPAPRRCSHARERDAFLVRKLRAGGAVVLGKTNLSEWANFRSFLSSSGWSGVGGQTNNPYVLDRNPCGSSSGSGAGISANLAVVAIGTETDGSIVCPSGANGIVGIKPTLGLISRSGVVPISAEQDTAGPMARNVTDAAVMLSVDRRRRSRRPGHRRQRRPHRARLHRVPRPQRARGKRIGVWKERHRR